MSVLTLNDVLIVDVDRTLCPVDTLSILRARWRLRNLLNSRRLAMWRSKSKQEEKMQLWKAVGFDCYPPSNSNVIRFIHKWKENGGYVAIVSGSSEGLAQWAARSLGDCADVVYGSTERENLTKVVKARFIHSAYEDNRRTYIGDSVDDLPVWKICHTAVVINSRRTKRLAIETLDQSIEYLPNTVVLYRILAWTKLLCSRFPNN